MEKRQSHLRIRSARECLKKERGRKGDRRRKENVNDENGERDMMRDANGK